MEKEATIIDKLCVCGGWGKRSPPHNNTKNKKKDGALNNKAKFLMPGTPVTQHFFPARAFLYLHSENVCIFFCIFRTWKNDNTWDYNLPIFTLQNDVIICFILHLVKTPSVGFCTHMGSSPLPNCCFALIGPVFSKSPFFSLQTRETKYTHVSSRGSWGGGGGGINNDLKKDGKRKENKGKKKPSSRK
jgi:hypothetical protein